MAGPILPFADNTGISVAPAGPPVGPPAATAPPWYVYPDYNSNEYRDAHNLPRGPQDKAPPVDPFANVRVAKELGGGQSTEGTNAGVVGAGEEAIAADKLFPVGFTPRMPQQDILQEGENWHLVGGKRGKELYRQAFDPSGTIAAVDEGQKALEDKTKETGLAIEAEQKRRVDAMAAIQSRRQDDMDEEARRMAYLDNETKRLSAGLMNQNAFWSNPGNIISAIAFSLMPIAGGDPAAGARLINQAIDADFNRRKASADMYLGELKSNLSGYRQLAGNRQAGDMLAEAEARRVAAMEVDRIANRFASQESRAKAEAIKAEMLNQSAQLQMQAYKMYGVHMDPRVVPKPLADAIRAGGTDGVGYQPFNQPTKPAPGAPGAAAVGTLSGGSPTTANTQGGASSAKVAALSTNLQEAVRQAKEGKIDVNTIYTVIGADNVRRVMAQHPMGGPAADNAMQKLRDRAEDELKTVGAALQPRVRDHNTLRLLQSDLDYLHKWYAEHPKEGSPEDFLQHMRDAGSFAPWLREMEMKYDKPGTPEAKAWMQWVQSSQRLHQLFAEARQGMIHGYAGSALSETELKFLNDIISQNPSFNTMRAFTNKHSQDAQAEIDNALSHVSPNAQLLWIARNPGYSQARLNARGISGRN